VVEGDPGSDWLWCIDPLDGTTNFAHGYPSFATSIGALTLQFMRCSVRRRGGPPASFVKLLPHQVRQQDTYEHD